MDSHRPLTYRVQNIPYNMDENGLRLCFHSDDRNYIEVKSLVPDVLNYDGEGTKTSTVLFTPREPREPRLDNEDIDIDRDFIGFTPLNEPASDVAADIIAITGLAGHAFGSWAHSAQKMWLRDYLPNDTHQRARLLIYGYESQLQGAGVAKSVISDYGNSFIQALMDIRYHPSSRDRPLILIGHSLGALIIKQAITDLSPPIRARLPVRTVLFFGAPHNGLNNTALKSLVKEQPTEKLISELQHDSATLSGLHERFLNFLDAGDSLCIHSYYESRHTKTVIEMSDGRWARSGKPEVMVEKSSALLQHGQEKTRMMVDGDHSQISKLRRGQGGPYPNVLRIILDALQSAAEQYAATAREQADISQPVLPEFGDPSTPESDETSELPKFKSMSTSVYTCTVCSKGFPYQHSLDDHMKATGHKKESNGKKQFNLLKRQQIPKHNSLHPKVATNQGKLKSQASKNSNRSTPRDEKNTNNNAQVFNSNKVKENRANSQKDNKTNAAKRNTSREEGRT